MKKIAAILAMIVMAVSLSITSSAWIYYHDDSSFELVVNNGRTYELSQFNDHMYYLRWKSPASTKMFKVYKYDSKKKKYVLFDTVDAQYPTKRSEVLTKKYKIGKIAIYGNLMYSAKYKIKGYDKNGKKVYQEIITKEEGYDAPISNLYRTKDKWTFSWEKQQKGATGYEVYIRKAEADSWQQFFLSDKDKWDTPEENGFTLYKKSSKGAEASLSFPANGKEYYISVRTFKIEDGKKVYSNYSSVIKSDSMLGYEEATVLKPKAVCSGQELELVKKYVNSVIDERMTNNEKLSAIMWLVQSRGKYQKDLSKIDGKRPVWQIMEKGEGQCATWAFCFDAMAEYVGFDVTVISGSMLGYNHFWCRINFGEQNLYFDAMNGRIWSSLDYNPSYVAMYEYK